jgi:hypothetical protein
MGLREQIQREIDSKETELGNLENQLREGRAYIQGLQKTLRLIGREQQDAFQIGEQTKVTILRHGSLLSQAREAILKAGRPLHITNILKAIGKPDDKQSRISLSGSLAAYVRKGEIFTRPEPNTFGLIEMGKSGDEDSGAHRETPPLPTFDNALGLTHREGDREDRKTASNLRH